MWRAASLLFCALLFSTTGIAAETSTAEPQQRPATQNTPKHPRPAAPVAARRVAPALGLRPALAQETQPQASGSAEDALKAEMEKRWPDAARIYRGLLAKEPDRVDLW